MCNRDMRWNPDFWETFKFNLYGVECLTFDIEWADKVKRDLREKKPIEAIAKIKMNTFHGKTTPQFQLSPL